MFPQCKIPHSCREATNFTFFSLYSGIFAAEYVHLFIDYCCNEQLGGVESAAGSEKVSQIY